jgi:hypothetical protein
MTLARLGSDGDSHWLWALKTTNWVSPMAIFAL